MNYVFNAVHCCLPDNLLINLMLAEAIGTCTLHVNKTKNKMPVCCSSVLILNQFIKPVLTWRNYY